MSAWSGCQRPQCARSIVKTFFVYVAASVLYRASMPETQANRFARKQIHEELAACLTKALKKSGLTDPVIARVTFCVVDDVAGVLGGASYYFPKNSNFLRATTARIVFERVAAGEPRAVIARDYSKTAQWVRQQVIRHKRQMHG